MPFLSVKEAALLVRKHPSSVRRAIYPIIENDQHPDRDQIQPSVADALSFRTQGVSFGWKVSEELLRKLIPEESIEAKVPHVPPTKISGAEGELIGMLRAELAIKNQQIQSQSELIAKQMGLFGDMSERLREGNVLIASLQQRLALSDGRTPHASPSDTTVAQEPKPAKSEKGSPPPSKPTKAKRGLFARMFR
jgi:hypothetical protein